MSHRSPIDPESDDDATGTTGLYNLPTVGRQRPATRRAAVLGWIVLWLVGVAAALTGLVDIGFDPPSKVTTAGSALLTVLFMVALTHRCGGRVRLWGGLTFVIAVTWLVWDPSWLTAGIAVIGAVSSAVLAVMLTRPAQSWWRAALEGLIAAVIAASGAIAVSGFEAEVLTSRYNIAVHILGLILTIGVVWGLGAGLHGLGRRGLVMILGGAVLILFVLTYGAVLRAYGSEAVIDTVDDTVAWLRDNIAGVPRPSEVLVGFPALVWGVTTRSTRRQGWWMCAFGVIGTSTIATSLVSPDAVADYVARSTIYSVVLGILIGLVIRRIDQMLTGGSGRRARRADSEAQIRPEPPRTAALR